MGNALVTISGDGLATAAVAKYLKISKENAWNLRTSLVELSNPKNLTIGRHLFHIAVSRSGVRPITEGRILDLLFTMFDTDGNDYINVRDFVGGIAPLSCPTDTLSQMLFFCLQVYDFDDTGEVCANELVQLLHTSARVFDADVNLVVSCFGDCAMSSHQIHKVVDNVFDTITMISENERDAIAHAECVDLLLQDPLIQKTAMNTLKEYNIRQRLTVSQHTTSSSPIVRVTTPSAPSFLTPVPMSRHSSYASSGVLSPRSQFSGGSDPVAATRSFTSAGRNGFLTGTYSTRTRSADMGARVSTGDFSASAYTASSHASVPSPSQDRNAQYSSSQRFFMDDEENIDEDLLKRKKLFVDNTRLDDQSLMTDFSSHFLQPLVYLPITQHGMSDELVSL